MGCPRVSYYGGGELKTKDETVSDKLGGSADLREFLRKKQRNGKRRGWSGMMSWEKGEHGGEKERIYHGLPGERGVWKTLLVRAISQV